MTKKQFTALVFSICVTTLALLYLGLAISSLVSAVNTTDDVNIDEVGPIGAMTMVAYMAMSGIFMALLCIGAVLHSAVGLLTAIAAVKVEEKAPRITAIVLISLNGALLAVAFIPLLISLIF